MSCDNDCTPTPGFPRPLFNRPALPRIGYRIGDYASMRAHMLGLIDAHPALAAWTHRGSDDPGIALVEGAALVGDVLALYQDAYANECLLRTATLDDSVLGLVRLLGYRPAPGIGGVARFALAVKGTAPVTVPAGLALQAQLEGADAPATFETQTALTAVPALSAFHLYRPRRVPSIVNGQRQFQLAGDSAPALRTGDRLLVGLAVGPAANAAYTHTQVLEVEQAWQAHGVQHVQTKGSLQALDDGLPLRLLFGPGGGGRRAPARTTSAPQLVAWKLAAPARHAGHDAPAQRVVVSAQGRATQQAVGFQRLLDRTHTADVQPDLAPRQLPLATSSTAITAGTTVLVQATLQGGRSSVQRVLARQVQQVDSRTLDWGGQSGVSSVLTLDADLAVTESGTAYNQADVRAITVHAVQGTAFALRAAPVPGSATSGHQLDFYGSAADAAQLQDRTLLLLEPTGPASARVQQVQRAASGEPRFTLTLDRACTYALYPHDEPGVTVHGNLVQASEGQTVPDTVLGDGDGRAAFATYPLPKAPLTWLLAPEVSPPQRPELEVRIDGRLWQRVDSFFDSGPLDTVYVVRDGPDGQSVVQFGDGVHGARVPSGRGNVSARWRTGSGSRGPLQAGASVSAKPRFTGFDKAFLPEPVTGGAAPEPASSVRLAAPGSLQSLGRIVSLADCETEAQSLPGVLKARARWDLVDGAPVLVLTVLTDGLASADRQALDAALRAAFSARGPAQCALRLHLGNRRFVRLGLRIGHDARLRSADLLTAVQQALGAGGDAVALDDPPTGGVFDWRARQFGQDVHGSQLVGRVQQVPGVAWVELTALGAAGRLERRLARGGSDRAGQALVATGTGLRCPADSLLALHADDLAVAWVATTGATP